MAEVDPGKTFFNILLLQNKSSKEISFNVTYNVPRNWELIGESVTKITLAPLAKISLPVRASVAKETMGGVGYAVVAIINDDSGTVYDTEYCFLNVPIKTSVKISTRNKERYFDNKTNKAVFFLNIENNGNIQELINLKIDPGNTVNIENGENNLLVKDILLKERSDTTLRYTVKLKEDIDYKNYAVHKVKLSVKGEDTLINNLIWFKYLDWKYDNYIPETHKPLIIELSAHNIFNNSQTSIRGHVYGRLLLKNNRDIFYSYKNRNGSFENNNLWLESRTFVGYTDKRLEILMGDYIGRFEQTMHGRGISATYKITNKQSVSGAFTRVLTRPENNYGFSYKFAVKAVNMELGGAYMHNEESLSNGKLGFAKTGFSFLKNHRLNLMGAMSNKVYALSDRLEAYDGFGYNIDYSGNIKGVKIKIKNLYGTPDYTGYSNGRFFLSGYSSYQMSEKSNLFLQYSNQKYRPSYFDENEIHFTDKYSSFENLRLQLNRLVFDNIYLFGGPVGENLKANNFRNYDTDAPFSVYTAKAEIGVRVYDRFAYNSLSITGRYGRSFVYDYLEFFNGADYSDRSTSYSIGEIALNYKRKDWGVHMLYFYGPYNISQHFGYFYSSFFPKSLNIMPYYNKFMFKKQIEIIIRGSYITNLATKNNRVNLNSSLKWNMKKGWSMHFLNSSSFHKRSGSQYQAGNLYTSTYFEFGIRKVFNFNQPRIKYYDFNAVFYKDHNGNRIHDANEPGVSNVLVNIQRKDIAGDLENPNYNGEFHQNELLSQQEGYITYNNFPEGDYIINYTPKGLNLGNYVAETVSREYTADRDTTLHIPFLERNKLFGKINLHRTKHSGLGDIPIDNIKITVEGDDKTYSSITDKEGYFEMYIPVSDYYKVRVNNIFFEHFNLRQEYYIVKFNGYKQFELSFDFDEKERKIYFDESDFLITDETVDDNFSFDDIKVIKQTNLKGVVKDANSLLPIHATVSVFNNSGELISETASSNRTGVYFTSFFAGDQYSLRVNSKGYWVYKEDLNIQQVTTFENINVDVLLKKVNIDELIESENLSFDSESAELTPLIKANLDNLLSMLLINTSVHIEISGHTDNIETLLKDANQLSEARARSVAGYLVKNGLGEERIKILVMGNSNPISTEDSENGRKLNRRVDIKVAGF